MLDFFTRTCIDGLKKTVLISTVFLNLSPYRRVLKTRRYEDGLVNPQMQVRVF